MIQQPYSMQVAGTYSTKPGVLATAHSVDEAGLAQEIPMAIAALSLAR